MSNDMTARLTLEAEDKASSVISGVANQIRGMAGQLMALAGIGVGAAGMGALVKQGMEFNSMMEDSKLSLASMISAFATFEVAGKKVTDANEKLTLSMAEAAKIQEQLRIAAIATTAEYGELVEALTAGFAPMAQSGVRLDQMVGLTQRLTQAATTLRVPMAQLGIEIRQLLEGDVARSSLMQKLGLTKEQIDEAKASGTLVELLTEKTRAFGLAGDLAAGTWSGLISNLKDGFKQITGSGFGEFFEWAKTQVAELGSALVTLKRDASGSIIGAEFNPELLALLEDIGSTLIVIGKVMKETVVESFRLASGAVKDFGADWRAVFEGAATLFVTFVSLVGAGIKTLTYALTSPAEYFGGMWSTVLDGVTALLAEFLHMLSRIPVIGKLFGEAAEGLDSFVVKSQAMSTASREWQANMEAIGEGPARALAELDRAFAGIGKGLDRTKKGADDAKVTLDGLGETGAAAGYHVGTAWADGAAKSLEAWEKVGPQLEAFLGDRGNSLVAKVEKTYQDLVAAVGNAVFQNLVPFEQGMELLRQLAEAKGEQIQKALIGEGIGEHEELGGWIEKLRTDWSREADWILKSTNTMAAGVTAAWLRIKTIVPTLAESTAGMVVAAWDTIGRGFEDSVFSVVTGRFDSLKDIFQGILDDILRSFSKFVTDMVMRWVTGQETMQGSSGWMSGMFGGGAYTGKEFQTASYGPGGSQSIASGVGTTGVAGALGGAAFGLGIGSAVGQIGNGKYNQTGAMIGGVVGGVLGTTVLAGAMTSIATALGAGASAGAAAGPIGALIGAVVGLIIGAISSPNTEKHVTGLIGNMIGVKTAYMFTPKGKDEYGDPLPGEVRYRGGAPENAGERAGAGVFETQYGWMTDLFKVGAKDTWTDLAKAYREGLAKSLEGANFDIAAGSPEDIQKTFETLMTNLLPRMALSAGFGQKGYLPAGDRDAAGGMAGFNWWAPGMDKDGKWVEKQLYDPNAPIPKMLAGLGFTAGKIGEIAQRLTTDDPEKFKAYLQGLVGIVVSMNELIANVGKSREQIYADMDKELAKTPADLFGSRAGDIASRFGELDQFSGDEQVKRAQEVLGLANQLWADALQYLGRIRDIQEQLTGSIDAQVKAVDDAFRSPAELTWRASNTAWEARGKIAGATTPEEVAQYAQEAQAAVGKVLDSLFASLKRGQDLLAGMTEIQAQWAAGPPVETNPWETWAADVKKLEADVTAASKLSGDAQLDALEKVRDSAASLWQTYLQMTKAIEASRAAVTSTIEKSLAQVDDLLRSPAERAFASQEKAWAARGGIAGAKSPEEVTRLLQESAAAAMDVISGLADKLKEVEAALASLTTSLDAQIAGITRSVNDLLDPGGASWRASERAWAARGMGADGTLTGGGLAGATDAAGVTAAVQEAQEAVGEIIDGLLSRLRQGKALAESLATLTDLFGGGAKGPGGVAGYLEDAAKVQQDIQAATKLSGQEQLDAIEKVKSAAEDLYSRQAQMIATIDANVASLTESIAQQKWDVAFSLMGEGSQEQVDAIQKRYRELQAQIAGANSPEEVQRLTGEMQGLLRTYYGMFKEGDPRRQEAAGWVTKELDTLQKTATEAYARMRKQIEEANAALKQGLETASGLVKTNMEETAAEIGRWRQFLVALRGEMKRKLGGMADDLKGSIAAWRQFLVDILGNANGKLDKFGNQLKEPGEKIPGLLGGAVDALTENINKTTGKITDWRNFLDSLKTDIETKLNGMADEVVRIFTADPPGFAKAIEEARTKFTDVGTAAGTAVGTETTGVTGLGNAANRAATSVYSLADAIDAAVQRINAAGATGGAASQAAYVVSARVYGRQAISRTA